MRLTIARLSQPSSSTETTVLIAAPSPIRWSHTRLQRLQVR